MRDWGIKRGYPNLASVIRKKTLPIIQLIRPATLVGAFAAGIFLTLLYSRVNGRSVPYLDSILVGLTLALLQAGGQAINQSIREEVEIDVLNGKTYRPTVTGALSLREGKAISGVLFVAGCGIAFSFRPSFGFYAMLIAFFAVTYTVPPFRVKRFFLLNNLHQGVARGLLPCLYVASMYSDNYVLPLLLGIPLTIWLTSCQTTKDWNDLEGDRAFNIRTLPVVLGKKKALRVMALLIAASFALLNLFVFSGLLTTGFLILNLLTAPSALILYFLVKDVRLKHFENNFSWLLFYGTLSAWYVLPVLIV